MSLEAGYRAALRWYPRGWRRANEDVMVGTLLDVADADGRVAPSRAELQDLRRAGLAARADVILPGPIRDRAAAISLGAGTALALALLTGQLWADWAPLNPDYPNRWAASAPEILAPDRVVWQLLLHPALWILGALAALAGWTVVSRVLLIASIPVSAIALTLTGESFLLRPSFFTLVMMAVLAVFACVGRPTRRWQLIATGIAVVLIASWLSFLGPFARTYFPRGGLVDFLASAWPSAAFFAAGAYFMIRNHRVAAGAVIVAASPWIVTLLGPTLIYTGIGAGLGYIVAMFLIAAILLVIPVAILLVVRRYARPPWLSPSESSDSPTSASRPSSTR